MDIGNEDTIDYTTLRDEEVVPVAREIIRRIGSRPDLLLGTGKAVTQAALDEYYSKVYLEDVMPVILEHNLKLVDLAFLQSIMMQAMVEPMTIAAKTLNHARDITDAKLYGVTDMRELRTAALHDKLQELFPKPVDK
jgi:hypothetical protein